MKIQAFTIVESMMALIIIMISFVAGMNIYLTLIKGDAFPLKMKVQNILHNVYLETKNEQRFIDEELFIEGLLINKNVQDYKAYQGILRQEQVYHVHFKAYTPEQELILEQEHLIRISNEN